MIDYQYHIVFFVSALSVAVLFYIFLRPLRRDWDGYDTTPGSAPDGALAADAAILRVRSNYLSVRVDDLRNRLMDLRHQHEALQRRHKKASFHYRDHKLKIAALEDTVRMTSDSLDRLGEKVCRVMGAANRAHDALTDVVSPPDSPMTWIDPRVWHALEDGMVRLRRPGEPVQSPEEWLAIRQSESKPPPSLDPRKFGYDPQDIQVARGTLFYRGDQVSD